MKLLLPLLLLLALVTGPLRPALADTSQSTGSYLLWLNTDGKAALWKVNTDGTFTGLAAYGPFFDNDGSPWTPKTMTEGADGLHILWACANHRAAVWNVNPDGTYTVAGGYGPYTDGSPSAWWNPLTMCSLDLGSPALTGAAGGDLTGTYPNPTVNLNAIDHTKLASDPASLGQVSGGNLTASTDGVTVSQSLGISDHLYVTNWGHFGGGISTQFVWLNGVSTDKNGGLGRALVNDGANGLTINYANDFGKVTVGSDAAISGNVTANTLTTASYLWTGDNIYSATGIFAGVGIVSHGFIHADGQIDAASLQLNGGSDLAEPYKIAPAANVQPAPGLVVSIDPAHTGQMRVCTRAYDATVGGIISGANGINPGITLRQAGTVADGTLPIASAGRVWCWCDADAGGAISPGDLLTTSATPGHAMKAADHARAQGAIIGKAMSPLATGKGLVLVLVSLQ